MENDKVKTIEEWRNMTHVDDVMSYVDGLWDELRAESMEVDIRPMPHALWMLLEKHEGGEIDTAALRRGVFMIHSAMDRYVKARFDKLKPLYTGISQA